MFARHLEMPPFDPARAPALPVDAWPRPRLEKAYRNYAQEYVKTAAPVMVQLFGPEDAGHLLHRTAKLIGMQFFHETAAAFGADTSKPYSASEFASFLATVLEAQDDKPTVSEQGGAQVVSHQGWRLMADAAEYHPACSQVLAGLFAGLAEASSRHLSVSLAPAVDVRPTAAFVWTIRGR